MASALVSAQNVVEAPFIIVKIGDYTFGQCTSKASKDRFVKSGIVTFPNFMKSLRIVKVNGTVNTYNLQMDYVITHLDDPNMLDRVFGSVANTRKILLSYGDWNVPSYIFKEEEAIITKVNSNIDFQSSKITYTIQCTSSALTLNAGAFSFPARFAKPSDVLKELLADKRFGLTDVFKGMQNMNTPLTSTLIASDDKQVSIDAKSGIGILEYVGYLVTCMESTSDTGGDLKSSTYFWSVYDDVGGIYGGSYFKVIKVTPNTSFNLSMDTFEVDIGYPSGNYITSFSLKSDDTWAILYQHSEKVQLPEYKYRIDDAGQIEMYRSPAITTSKTSLKTTNESKNWWSQVTQHPVMATLTIKGLLRPSILMSYVKINAYFYGRKHISSGLYIITKQEDSIDEYGYKTTLSLTRVGADSDVS